MAGSAASEAREPRGEEALEAVRVTVIDYDKNHSTSDGFKRGEVVTVDDCGSYAKKETVTWINIDGLRRPDLLQEVQKVFNLDSLLIRDLQVKDQPPRWEDYGEYVYVLLRMLRYPEEGDLGEKQGELDDEQVSFIACSKYVITIQEREGDVFDAVRNRIERGEGHIRQKGADFLLYALIDAIIDKDFDILGRFEDELQVIENRLSRAITQKTRQASHIESLIEHIFRIRKDWTALRRSVLFLRTATDSLAHESPSFFHVDTKQFLRDLYDHTLHLMHVSDSLRDSMIGLTEVYLSTISHRMNRVMKVLTVIATIFVPLSFVTGIFGMEILFQQGFLLQGGFFFILAGMAAIGVSLALVFWWRGLI